MKDLIKKIIPDWLKEQIKIKTRSSRFKNKHIKETFSYINENKYWSSEESVSGNGSEIAATKELVNQIQHLIKKKNIKSILDIPCGDFNWMQYVNFQGVNYIGSDIVEGLIDKNNLKFGKENMAFKTLDLTKDTLPCVDLVFCRDCLVHLSYKDICKALINIKKSKSKYFVTTSFSRCINNKDIITGQWRKLNFEITPFSFQQPLFVIDENYTMKGDNYSDKMMILYKVSDIPLSFKLKLYYWFS